MESRASDSPASTGVADLSAPPAPDDVLRRLAKLEGLAEARHADWLAVRADKTRAELFLDAAPRAEAVLDELQQALFGEVLAEIETSLSQAVREILGQERTIRSETDIKAGRLTVRLRVEQDGKEEDILVGQGGSVCNILSVSLRLIALSRLDPARHRPFLVLDEQDCWLKPELVPGFMRLIGRIAERLKFQVLVISHHSLDLFFQHAEKVYALAPSREHGVRAVLKKAGSDAVKGD